jgi:hypothetical protein
MADATPLTTITAIDRTKDFLMSHTGKERRSVDVEGTGAFDCGVVDAMRQRASSADDSTPL